MAVPGPSCETARKGRLTTDIDHFGHVAYPPRPMSPLCRAVTLLLAVIGSSRLGADERNLATQDGVLVLRNGFVLEGRITPLNDMYLVSIGENGEVRLPRSEVEFQCSSLDDAYLRQRDGMISDDPASHLSLADWCLRHRLLARASDQLLIVHLLEPGNQRLTMLEQRLNSLASQSVPASQDGAPRTEPTIPIPAAPPKISPQLMQQFTTIIQPILLNRCAAYTCHGNGSSGNYRLIRPAVGHATTSRVTHRNLQATQAFIDSEHPENSCLLRMGNIPHGGAKPSSINEKHVQQWELVTEWIHRAALPLRASVVANSGGPKRSAFRTDVQKVTKPFSESGQLSTASGIPGATPSKVTTAGHLQDDLKSNPVSPASHEPPADQDPFDPEIFNRQYHPTQESHR